MSVTTTYKETIGYEEILFRQIDHIREVLNKLHRRVRRYEYEYYLSELRQAVATLLDLLAGVPEVLKNIHIDPLDDQLFYDVERMDLNEIRKLLRNILVAMSKLKLTVKPKKELYGGEVELLAQQN